MTPIACGGWVASRGCSPGGDETSRPTISQCWVVKWWPSTVRPAGWGTVAGAHFQAVDSCCVDRRRRSGRLWLHSPAAPLPRPLLQPLAIAVIVLARSRRNRHHPFMLICESDSHRTGRTAPFHHTVGVYNLTAIGLMTANSGRGHEALNRRSQMSPPQARTAARLVSVHHRVAVGRPCWPCRSRRRPRLRGRRSWPGLWRVQIALWGSG